jgi:uncharacterized protein (UPF0276 family)
MANVPPAPDRALIANAASLQPLGIGIPYLSALPTELYRLGLVDFVELTPESLCRERRDSTVARMNLVPELLERAREVCQLLPIVVHGVVPSIGSAENRNDAYLDMLDQFQRCWPFVWYSEHLSYLTIPGENGLPREIGERLPSRCTGEATELIARRASAILSRYGVPFLLENPAHYSAELPYEVEIEDEIALLTRIMERSGCYQLLDLHNLYCNARNLGFDPFAAIDRIALDRVLEIHVAARSRRDGFWMNAHDGRVPDPVWELLVYTLPRCPNVAGLVFELLENHAAELRVGAIAQELMRARYLWKCYGPGGCATEYDYE